MRNRNQTGDDRGGEQDADADQQRPEPAIDSPLALCLALARRLALVEEPALELVQLRIVARRPVERRGEPGAAVELGGFATRALPLGGGIDQVLVEPTALDVVGEPGT